MSEPDVPPVGVVSSDRLGLAPERDTLTASIFEALLSIRLCYTIDEDGDGGFPLVGALTPDGDDSITRGLDELRMIADTIADGIEHRPLTDDQALALARRHLDQGLSWAPHITRCNDLEIRALIRAVEAAHGIGA